MARADEKKNTSLMGRIIGSVWLKTALFVAVFLLLTTLMTSGTGSKVQEGHTDFLADAVRRAAVQCYALEGSFPNNLKYLEENYGLIIDYENYAVYYESMGDNLLPSIRVIPLTR